MFAQKGFAETIIYQCADVVNMFFWQNYNDFAPLEEAFKTIGKRGRELSQDCDFSVQNCQEKAHWLLTNSFCVCYNTIY
jgi:hypothetical protein